jgi:hypothetical protein
VADDNTIDIADRLPAFEVRKPWRQKVLHCPRQDYAMIRRGPGIRLLRRRRDETEEVDCAAAAMQAE